MSETVATVKELSDLWKPGALGRVSRFVMNCSCFRVYLFVLVAYFPLFAGPMIMFFSDTLFLLFFFFLDYFEWVVRLRHWLLCRVTLQKAVEAAAYISTLQKFTLTWYIGAHSRHPPLSTTYIIIWRDLLSALSFYPTPTIMSHKN